MNQERSARIRQDLAALEAIAAHSSIFTFRTLGEPVERLSLTFRGAGLAKTTASEAKPELIHQHEIELRLPFSYPTSPPDIRWLTPIFHPNISFSGFVNLADVGLSWEAGMGIDVVCERLWDMARLAEFNPAKAVSYAAKKWLEDQTDTTLPLDQRPLRDRAANANRNVVKYRRKGQPLPGPGTGELMFIDDDAPAPPLPPGSNRAARATNSNDDVLYIE